MKEEYYEAILQLRAETLKVQMKEIISFISFAIFLIGVISSSLFLFNLSWVEIFSLTFVFIFLLFMCIGGIINYSNLKKELKGILFERLVS